MIVAFSHGVSWSVRHLPDLFSVDVALPLFMNEKNASPVIMPSLLQCALLRWAPGNTHGQLARSPMQFERYLWLGDA